MKECKNCYGKGYFTELKGDTAASPDFVGDKRHVVRKGGIRIKRCDCQIGNDLKKYFSIKKEYRF